MIYYFTPHNPDKCIGKAHNKHCELVPNNDDWICIRDGDTLFPLPDYGNFIENIISLHGNKYQIFTAITNRIGVSDLRYKNISFNEGDISVHLEKAKKLSLDLSVTSTNIAAGFFMLFQKKVWQDVGGFSDNSIRFDIEFSTSVKKKGYQIGRINGLYILHLYRWGQPNPQYYINHLK